jgi:hypothetical protein
MKEKIKEVEKYFKQKLISGDFAVTKITCYEIILLIDDDYVFILWIASGLESLRINDAVGSISFMNLQFTQAEIKQLWSIVEPIIKKYNKDVLLKKKTEQFYELKKELKL